MKKIWIIILLVLIGCTNVTEENLIEEKTSTSFFAMDTFMTVTLLEGNNKVLDEIETFVINLDNKWSHTNENSEIHKINTEKNATLSDDTIEILRFSYNLSEKTQGDFDISIYPIVCEWGFINSDYKVPTQDKIDEILQNLSYKNIEIIDNDVKIGENTEITLGAIAKGYVADEIVRILKENKVTSAVIDLGGNVHVLGVKADGSNWNVGIRDPIDAQGVIGVVSTTEKAVVTSGGYERFFEENNEIYWHIMNPHTGYPAKNGIISTTIVADEGIYADALSTTLFVMGVDKAIEFYQEHRDFDFVIITENSAYVTENLKDNFVSNLSNVEIVN